MVMVKTTVGLMPYINWLDDGTTHLNIYSKAETQLGKDLSNFSGYGFEHPDFGRFASMEGYWYWLATGMRHDQLRWEIGYNAKRLGRLHERVTIPNFESLIIEGLHCKLAESPSLYGRLTSEYVDLPLSHYYFSHGIIADRYDSSKFWLEELDNIRQGLPLKF